MKSLDKRIEDLLDLIDEIPHDLKIKLSDLTPPIELYGPTSVIEREAKTINELRAYLKREFAAEERVPLDFLEKHCGIYNYECLLKESERDKNSVSISRAVGFLHSAYYSVHTTVEEKVNEEFFSNKFGIQDKPGMVDFHSIVGLVKDGVLKFSSIQSKYDFLNCLRDIGHSYKY